MDISTPSRDGGIVNYDIAEQKYEGEKKLKKDVKAGNLKAGATS